MNFTIENKLKLFIFFFSFLIFSNTIGHDFAWDDSIVITENPRVQKGIMGIPKLFLKYNSDYKADKYGYRPITLSSFAIDYSVSKNNASFFHLMNIIYYAILCLVIFKVIRKIFDEISIVIPFAITILFIAHPLHTEVVANIKSRDEIFSMMFGLLSLNAILNYIHTKQAKYLLFSFSLFIIAFLSKESAIVFLGLIVLVIFCKSNWVINRGIIKPIAIIIPLLLICFAIVNYYTKSKLGVESSKGAGIYYESGILGNSFFYTDVLTSKIANALAILLMYLKNFIWPTNLVYYYGYNQIPVANWTDINIIISLIIHCFLMGYAVINLKKNKQISLGILFYFISISIYTHILRAIADTMADRFMFVPSLGLIIVFVFTLTKVLKINLTTLKIESILRFSKTIQPSETRFKYSLISVIAALSIATFNRNKVWKNDETLISHDMPKLERCARAHNYYANILKSKLNKSFNPTTEQEMISHYKKSIQISDESYYSYIGLGSYYIDTKKHSEALAIFTEMIKKYPNQADPNFYLGKSYYYVKDYSQSISYLRKSLDLAPEVSNTYFYLALSLSGNGEYDNAIAITTLNKQKFGESASIYEVLGNIYFDKGDLDQSTKYTFEMLKYGANEEAVYGKVIGRYQSKKMDNQASFYYKQAINKGLFRSKIQ